LFVRSLFIVKNNVYYYFAPTMRNVDEAAGNIIIVIIRVNAPLHARAQIRIRVHRCG